MYCQKEVWMSIVKWLAYMMCWLSLWLQPLHKEYIIQHCTFYYFRMYMIEDVYLHGSVNNHQITKITEHRFYYLNVILHSSLATVVLLSSTWILHWNFSWKCLMKWGSTVWVVTSLPNTSFIKVWPQALLILHVLFKIHILSSLLVDVNHPLSYIKCFPENLWSYL